jgi:hypothetical protein
MNSAPKNVLGCHPERSEESAVRTQETDMHPIHRPFPDGYPHRLNCPSFALRASSMQSSRHFFFSSLAALEKRNAFFPFPFGASPAEGTHFLAMPAALPEARSERNMLSAVHKSRFSSYSALHPPKVVASPSTVLYAPSQGESTKYELPFFDKWNVFFLFGAPSAEGIRLFGHGD